MSNRSPITTEDTAGGPTPLEVGSVVASTTPGYWKIAAAALSGISAWGISFIASIDAAAAKLLLLLTKGDVGLGNVDNTSDINKPVSTAQATADNLRVLKAGDTMTGDLTITGNKSLVMSQAAIYNLTRTIPTVVGDYIELCSITNVNFAGNVEIWYNAHNNNFSQSKRYFLPLSYNATAGAWQKLAPFSTTGPYVGNDADVEIRVNLGVAYFRIRRASGTTAGDADIVFLLGGSADETTFTPQTGTGAGTTPTAYYSVKAEATNSDFVGGGLTTIPFTNRSLVQAGNFPIVIGSYSLSSWAGTGAKVPLFAVCATSNGGSTPSAAQPALVLGREGVNAQAYGNMAEFKLRRTNAVGVEARTGLTIALTHGAAATSGTDVLDLKSDGTTTANILVANTSLNVGGGTTLTKFVVYTPTLTPASITANTIVEQTFSVTGLLLSDTVIVNPPSACAMVARVSAVDTLALSFHAPSGSTYTPPGGTYRVLAVRS